MTIQDVSRHLLLTMLRLPGVDVVVEPVPGAMKITASRAGLCSVFVVSIDTIRYARHPISLIATIAREIRDSIENAPPLRPFDDLWREHEAQGPPRARVVGDHESAVSAGAVTELVALAKAGNREDFDFLAGASGVEDREALWNGTRRRLGKDASELVSPEGT